MYEKSLFNPLLLLAGLLVSNLSVAQVTLFRTRNKLWNPQMVYFRSTKPIYEMGRFEFMYRPANHTANRCCLHLAFGKSGRRRQLLRTGSFERYAHCCSSRSYRYQQYVWVHWLATSASTGQQQCADKQYCLDYTGISEAAYLNAADTSWDYGVTVYEMGTHQASGWFFYPAQYTPPTATKTVSVKSADSAKGSVSIEGKESTSVEVPETEVTS